jgi:hypothetical protein
MVTIPIGWPLYYATLSTLPSHWWVLLRVYASHQRKHSHGNLVWNRTAIQFRCRNYSLYLGYATNCTPLKKNTIKRNHLPIHQSRMLRHRLLNYNIHSIKTQKTLLNRKLLKSPKSYIVSFNFSTYSYNRFIIIKSYNSNIQNPEKNINIINII